MKRTIRVDADLIRRLSAAVDGVEKHTAKLDAFARVLGFPHQTAMMGALAVSKPGRPSLTMMFRDVYRQGFLEATQIPDTRFTKQYLDAPVEIEEMFGRAVDEWQHVPDLDALFRECRRNGMSDPERFIAGTRLQNIVYAIRFFGKNETWRFLRCEEAQDILMNAARRLMKTDTPPEKACREVSKVSRMIRLAWQHVPERDRTFLFVTPEMITRLAMSASPGLTRSEREARFLSLSGWDTPGLKEIYTDPPENISLLEDILDLRRRSELIHRDVRDIQPAVIARSHMTAAAQQAAHCVVQVLDGATRARKDEDINREVSQDFMRRAAEVLMGTPEIADAALKIAGSEPKFKNGKREKKLDFVGLQVLLSGWSTGTTFTVENLMAMPLFDGPVRRHTLNNPDGVTGNHEGMPSILFDALPSFSGYVLTSLIGHSDSDHPILLRNEGTDGFVFTTVEPGKDIRSRLSLRMVERALSFAQNIPSALRACLSDVISALNRKDVTDEELCNAIMSADTSGLDRWSKNRAADILCAASHSVVIRDASWRERIMAAGDEMSITG